MNKQNKGGRLKNFNKPRQINFRIEESSLFKLQEVAKSKGLPYSELIRQYIDDGMERDSAQPEQA